MNKPTPQRVPFDPQAFLATKLNCLPRLAPLRRTELPLSFFAEGSNPFDLLLKPAITPKNGLRVSPTSKTVIEYLKALPAHLDALREVFAFNLILKEPDTAQMLEIKEQYHITGNPLSREMQLVDNARQAVKPLVFLRKIGAIDGRGNMMEELKRDVKSYFHFDFDAFKERIRCFVTALETSEKGKISPKNGVAIKDGFELLRDLKPLYGEVIARLYSLVEGDIDSIESNFAPFRKVLGALAYRLQIDIKASIPKKAEMAVRQV